MHFLLLIDSEMMERENFLENRILDEWGETRKYSIIVIELFLIKKIEMNFLNKSLSLEKNRIDFFSPKNCFFCKLKLFFFCKLKLISFSKKETNHAKFEKFRKSYSKKTVFCKRIQNDRNILKSTIHILRDRWTSGRISNFVNKL